MAEPSLIGFAVGTVTDPTGPAPSRIGFASGMVRQPHLPIGVKTADGMRFTRILTKTSTGLR